VCAKERGVIEGRASVEQKKERAKRGSEDFGGLTQGMLVTRVCFPWSESAVRRGLQFGKNKTKGKGGMPERQRREQRAVTKEKA